MIDTLMKHYEIVLFLLAFLLIVRGFFKIVKFKNECPICKKTTEIIRIKGNELIKRLLWFLKPIKLRCGKCWHSFYYAFPDEKYLTNVKELNEEDADS